MNIQMQFKNKIQEQKIKVSLLDNPKVLAIQNAFFDLHHELIDLCKGREEVIQAFTEEVEAMYGKTLKTIMGIEVDGGISQKPKVIRREKTKE